MNNQIPGGSELDKCVQRMKPILFNTEMVRAILDGRKTVTRRVVKVRYRDDEAGFQVITNKYTGAFVRIEKVDENECGIFSDGTERYVNAPYDVGDILWVREAWRMQNYGFDSSTRTYQGQELQYRADFTYEENELYGRRGGCTPCKWRPSIHMPREAARIFLRVVDVRAEKLQEIDKLWSNYDKEGMRNPDIENISIAMKERFISIWNSTIPKHPNKSKSYEYDWDANPWVWVIEFEKCEKPMED